MTQTVRFSAIDTLFFREGRNYDFTSGLPVTSLRLPSLRTLYGAIRARLWGLIPEQDRVRIIGDHSDLPCQLRMSPLRLRWQGEIYVPMPQDIAVFESEAGFFSLGQPMLTDIGNTDGVLSHPRYFRFPELDPNHAASSEPKNAKQLGLPFITQRALAHWFAGDAFSLVSSSQAPSIIDFHALLEPEIRLGIELNKRNAKEGQLYQTEHLRFGDIQFEVDIYGLAPDLVQKLQEDVNEYPVQRLGADGRGANIELLPSSANDLKQLNLIKLDNTAPWYVMTLLSPLIAPHEDYNNGYLPVMDEKIEQGEQEAAVIGMLCFRDITNAEQNELQRVEQISGCIGKPGFDSGWDMANGKPRASFTMLPAGSCFYVRNTPDLAQTLNKLQTWQQPAIGNHIHMGFGAIAVKPAYRKENDNE